MLERLSLTDVGPSPRMEIELAPRLNFLTGDNGLGKTFLLDIAWWALTGSWARMPARPHRGPHKAPAIAYRYEAATGTAAFESVFDREAQGWPFERHRPPISALAIYAQVDGGFSAWDPARNGRRADALDGPDLPDSYRLEPGELWHGLPRGPGRKLCNGLVADWGSWQRETGEAFAQLTAVLRALSSSKERPLVPGKLTRVSLDDVRDHPTVIMPYGQDVPLVHASAGMRRVAALAYLLVWTWQEHVRAADLLGAEPVEAIVFLVDELEAHLHPQWQRRIVPALIDVVEALAGTRDVAVQLVGTTHSPLVLASVEPDFDEARDSVFELELRDGEVSLARGGSKEPA